MVDQLRLVRDSVKAESPVKLGEGDLVARKVPEEGIQMDNFEEVQGCFSPIATVCHP